MKRFLFAVAVVALFAAVGGAADVPTAPAPTPVAVTSATPVEMVPATTAAPARRGLFSRLRNRNAGTTSYSTPATTTTTVAPSTVTPATPMPTVAPPQAMPGAKPVGGMVAPVAAEGVMVAGGMMSTMGDASPVMMASATTPAPARRGLFSRLRNR